MGNKGDLTELMFQNIDGDFSNSAQGHCSSRVAMVKSVRFPWQEGRSSRADQLDKKAT